MEKCIYKSSENTCCRSTSENHCKIVYDGICRICPLHQTTITVNDKTKFQRIMKQAADALEDNNTKEALRILDAGLKI